MDTFHSMIKMRTNQVLLISLLQWRGGEEDEEKELGGRSRCDESD